MDLDPPSRLARRLTTFDAVVIGLGAMIGAGVFSAIGPAARAAGSGLLLGLVVAAVVAYCNATSSARLAALYPQSGGTYVYGRMRLGSLWGFAAGWAFVAGKVASCSVIALTFAAYLPLTTGRRIAAVALVGALTLVNYRGVRKTALATRGIVLVVVAVLVVVIVACASGPNAVGIGRLTTGGPRGALHAAGVLFFAFAGYARIATLGEEVIDPQRAIPRAIPIALAITLVVYGAVAVTALTTAGPEALASARAPLATAVTAAGAAWAVPLVRGGAVVASAGVLLSLLVGVSRTVFAMSADHELPRQLAAVHPRNRVPHRAEVVVGATVAVLTISVDLRDAITFSSFCVLVYYAIANASALTLRRRRVLPAVGLVGCVVVAFSLPTTAIALGCVVIAVGTAARVLTR